MSTWRKRLFIALAHNAATPATYFQTAPRPHGCDGLAHRTLIEL